MSKNPPPTATIQDSCGNVHSGRVVDTSSHEADTAFGIVTGGLGFVADVLTPSSKEVTVEVNGTRHSGNRI